ncbi:DNA ligase D [Chryseobacterium sp.]|uniref:DNA ligase D n=1 Tax=Chryseobacterium sp. TaxID=1871047 RepID=UPI002613D0DE|nr:DNA ligase D [Chryseobacterium sp.]
MALEDYNKKRNFKETSEPEGKEKASGKKLKFVIQRHAASRLHYDFRLEMEGVLKSWAVPKGPSLNPSDKRLAMMVEDHPYSYRTFEGSIPKGNYGAGEVEIWDEGTYEPIEKVNGKTDDLIMRAELHKQSLKFILHGKKLKGEFALVKIKNSKDENAWLLIKHKDKFAVDENYDAEDHTLKTSKVSAYLEEKENKKKNNSSESLKHYKNYAPALSSEKKWSEFIKPMLCKVSDKAFDNKDWAFEIKWDGYRAIADLTKDELRLYSRNGIDFSQKFKKITNSLNLQEHPMILDGEIVAYDDKGRPNFQWLQRIGDNPNLALTFQVFDLLWLNGHSTENLSYLQRKELLKDALMENEIIKYSDHILENGRDFFQAAKDMGLEGIVAKKTDSLYKENLRSSEWLKIKIHKSDEAVICGFTEPKGSRKKLGALILGKYLNGEMVFCGHTGGGFNDKLLSDIYDEMQPLIEKNSVFKITPKTNTKATWVKPELVAEIKFSELTKDNIYRHPIFLRLRDDINPKDVKFNSENPSKNENMKKTEPKKRTGKEDVIKKIGKQELKLTNQNKIYFPEDDITKSDVIDFYQSISKYILPHLKDRPQSMNRYPNGIKGLSFFQKDAAEETPEWIETQKVFSESSDKYINYIICNDKETLAYLNNLGCIELNIWTSKIKKADNPDYLVLDLDPSEKNSFEDVIETAYAVKEVLDLAGVDGYPKTSGSSGIHVYIPMNAKYSYDQVKDFGHLLMQIVQKKLPDLTTLERSLQKRDKNKIYLDYLQNRRGQTLASVYSLRPKDGAPVSMPLQWEEVKNGLKPTDFNIHNALERLKDKGDIFKPVLGKGIDMLKAITTLEGLFK